MHLFAPGKRGCRREVKFIPAQRGKVSWLVYQYDGRTTAKVNTMLFSSWKALTEAVLLQYSYILGTGQRGERGVTSHLLHSAEIRYDAKKATDPRTSVTEMEGYILHCYYFKTASTWNHCRFTFQSCTTNISTLWSREIPTRTLESKGKNGHGSLGETPQGKVNDWLCRQGNLSKQSDGIAPAKAY